MSCRAVRSEHIHTRSDGRGIRRVFVNGNEIRRAIRADTKRGEVIFAPSPIRLKRNKELYTRMLRGVVTVEQVSNAVE